MVKHAAAWLKLQLPAGEVTLESAQELGKAAIATGLPLEFSSAPALFGQVFRGEDVRLCFEWGKALDKITLASAARDALLGDLLAAMACAGTAQLYAVLVVPPPQIELTLLETVAEALSECQADGMVRFSAWPESQDPTNGLADYRIKDGHLIPRLDAAGSIPYLSVSRASEL